MAQDLKSWDSIANDPEYQALGAAKQLQVIKEYREAGGTPEESTSSEYITPVVNALQGAGASAARGVSQAVGGATEMLGDVIGSKGVSNAGRELQHNAETVYAQNTQSIKGSASGQFGMKYGEVATDIAATVAAPEIMIPVLAAKATGRSYAEQREGDKSALKAAGVGVVNAAANTLLPSVGGKLIAPIARLGEGSGGVISKALTGTGKEAVIGAGAGAATGASEAAAKGGDAAQGAIEGAKTGAIFGGAIRGVREVPNVAGKIKDLPNAFKSSNVSPNAATVAKITTQGEAINHPDNVTPVKQSEAFNNAPEHNFIRSAELNKAYDVPVIPQSAKGNVAGHEVLNVNAKQADNALSKYSDATIGTKSGSTKEIVNRTKEGADKMDSVIKTSQDSATNAVSNMKAQVRKEYAANKREGDDTSAKAERFAALDKFGSQLKEHNTNIKNGNINTAQKSAIELKQDFDNLHPTDKAEFLDRYKSPEHFTDGFDPIAHTHEYLGAKQQQQAILDSAPQAPTAIMNIGDIVAGAKKAVIKETFGTVRNMQQRIASKNAEAITNKINTNEPASQQQITALTAMNHPLANKIDVTQREAATALRGGKPLPKAPPVIDPATGQPVPMSPYGIKAHSEARHLELDKVRSKIVDPALQSKITLDNMRNTEHVTNIKRQDAIANIPKQRAAVELANKATVARQSAQHEKSIKEIDRWHKEDAPYIPYKAVSDAMDSVKNESGKIVSSARVKSEALKTWSKLAGMKGTGNKAEFMDFVSRSPVNIKAQGNQLITDAFSGGKVTPEQAKNLWSKLHDIESQAHKANGHDTLARSSILVGAGKAKLIDQVRASNQQQDLNSVMHNAIKESLKASSENIPKTKLNDFIDSHIESITKQGQPLSNVQHQTARVNAEKAAKDFADNYHTKTPVENEETVGGKSEATEEARKAQDEAGKVSEEGKKAVEDHIIDEAETAFKNGDIDKMKEHLESAINHYFKGGVARRRALTKYVDNMATAKENIAKGMKPEEALTLENFHDMRVHGNLNAGGLMGKLSIAITGKDYPKVQWLTEAERAAKLKPTKEGALKSKKPRIKLKLRQKTS